MGIRNLLADLVSQRIREYLSESPVSGDVPRLYPPATEQQVAELGRYARQELEPGYKEFLLMADGMEGFFPGMRILGCRDWVDEGPEATSQQFLEILQESGTPMDVGLPGNVVLFPVAIDGDAAQGIFMLQLSGSAPERFWWVGEGDSMFFGTFADLLGYLIDFDSYSPRDSVDPGLAEGASTGTDRQ